MVAFVLGHYARFLLARAESPRSSAVVRENRQIGRFSEPFEN